MFGVDNMTEVLTPLVLMPVAKLHVNTEGISLDIVSAVSAHVSN